MAVTLKTEALSQLLAKLRLGPSGVAVLRGFDDAGVKLIWIEAPPDQPDWEGVRDRLQRAAAAG